MRREIGIPNMELLGYARETGAVGFRNHLTVVSTVFCSGKVAKSIADSVEGAKAVVHEAGCMAVGLERAHTERVLGGIASHPNVGAVLAVGLGCEQLDAKTLSQACGDRPSAHISIQDVGGTRTAIRRGIKIARRLVGEIASARRTPCEMDTLILGTLCGSSDANSGLVANPVLGRVADAVVEAGGAVLLGESGSLYGAAGLLAKRAATSDIARRIREITDAVEAHYTRMGRSLREGNPTRGNIEGGLTTLTEKSIGGVTKGGTTRIQGVLDAGEAVPGRGLWIVDTTLGLDSHVVSDMAACGAQVLAFTTGRGNPVGCPVAPVIKITATKETACSTLRENIDFDASPVTRGEETPEHCAKRLLAKLGSILNGELSKAEVLGHCEFGIGRVAAR